MRRRWGGMMGRRMLAGAVLAAGLRPVAAGPAASPAAARAEERIRFALAVLCPRCADDIEADGVNRPMRRAIVAGTALNAAHDALRDAVAAGQARHAAAMRPVGRAIQALQDLDEEAAARQARRALRMMEALP